MSTCKTSCAPRRRITTTGRFTKDLLFVVVDVAVVALVFTVRADGFFMLVFILFVFDHVVALLFSQVCGTCEAKNTTFA